MGNIQLQILSNGLLKLCRLMKDTAKKQNILWLLEFRKKCYLFLCWDFSLLLFFPAKRPLGTHWEEEIRCEWLAFPLFSSYVEGK